MMRETSIVVTGTVLVNLIVSCCIQELKKFRRRLGSVQFASSEVILNMLMTYRDIQVGLLDFVNSF